MSEKAKVTYKIKNLDTVFNAIKDIYKEVVSNSQDIEAIAKFARDRIVAETRKGKDLSRDGAKQPPLSAGYIRTRRNWLQQNKNKQKKKIKESHGPVPDQTFFSPGRSNLTITGRLLESIDYSIKGSSAIAFGAKGTEKTILIEPTGQSKGGLSNKRLAEYLSQMTPPRTFLGLDNRGLKRISNMIADAIRRIATKKGF